VVAPARVESGKVNFEVSKASMVFSPVTGFPHKNFCVHVVDVFHGLLLINNVNA
ncbi:unnamed protein product, partial [Adineta steineri]